MSPLLQPCPIVASHLPLANLSDRLNGAPASGQSTPSLPCILVVRDDRLVGSVTADALLQFQHRCADWETRTVGELVEPDPVAIAADRADDPLEVAALMSRHRLQYLPVVDGGRPLGAIAADRAIAALAETLRSANQALETAASDRALAEAQASSYAHQMQLVFEALPELVLVLDDRGQQIDLMPTQFARHPDERQAVVDATLDRLMADPDANPLLDRVQRAICERRIFTLEYEIAAADRAYWFAANIAPLDGDRALWVARDITAAKTSETALRDTQTQLQQSLQRLEGRNRDMERLRETSELLQTCTTLEEFAGVLQSGLAEFFPGCAGGVYVLGDRQTNLEALAFWKSTADPQPLARFRLQDCWAMRRGRDREFRRSCDRLCCAHVPAAAAAALCLPMSARGNLTGLLTLSTDSPEMLSGAKRQLAAALAAQIALTLANLKLQLRLLEENIRDPLTGLFNRRYLDETLDRELHRATRQNTPLSLLTIDADYFKRFNDAFGHGAGDAVLQILAQVLQTRSRLSDVVCRFGGEEFVLVMPEASLADATRRAEQIRQDMGDVPLVWNGQDLGRLTLSLGVAAFPTHGSKGSVLLAKADEALYRAKSAGRDCVVVAETLEPVSSTVLEDLLEGDPQANRRAPRSPGPAPANAELSPPEFPAPNAPASDSLSSGPLSSGPVNSSLSNSDVSNPDISNPDISNPDISTSKISSSDTLSSNISSSNISISGASTAGTSDRELPIGNSGPDPKRSP